MPPNSVIICSVSVEEPTASAQTMQNRDIAVRKAVTSRLLHALVIFLSSCHLPTKKLEITSLLVPSQNPMLSMARATCPNSCPGTCNGNSPPKQREQSWTKATRDPWSPQMRWPQQQFSTSRNKIAWRNYVHMTSKDCNKLLCFFFTPQLRRQSSNSIQLPTHVLHEQLVFASLVSSWPKKNCHRISKNIKKSCLSSPSTGRMFPQESASTRIKVLGNL